MIIDPVCGERTNRGKALVLIAAGIAALVALPCAAAEEMGFRKTVGDYSIFLTVMRVEVIKGPRPPAARDTHHVMVSIFDTRSGLRVSGWEVRARVAALGFSGEKRDLEPISVGGVDVYGNTFPMPGRGPFRVDVEYRAHDRPTQQTTFYFTHPSFAAPTKSTSEGRTHESRP